MPMKPQNLRITIGYAYDDEWVKKVDTVQDLNQLRKTVQDAINLSELKSVHSPAGEQFSLTNDQTVLRRIDNDIDEAIRYADEEVRNRTDDMYGVSYRDSTKKCVRNAEGVHENCLTAALVDRRSEVHAFYEHPVSLGGGTVHVPIEAHLRWDCVPVAP